MLRAMNSSAGDFDTSVITLTSALLIGGAVSLASTPSRTPAGKIKLHIWIFGLYALLSVFFVGDLLQELVPCGDHDSAWLGVVAAAVFFILTTMIVLFEKRREAGDLDPEPKIETQLSLHEAQRELQVFSGLERDGVISKDEFAAHKEWTFSRRRA